MAVELQARETERTLGEIVEEIVSVIQQKYPQARCLLNDEVYGDEDVYVDIYVDEDLMPEVDRFAHELTYRYWQETGYDVLPIVAPKECYPIKE